MSDHPRWPPATWDVDDSVTVAVRPSRLQIAAVRLSLLLNGSEGRLPIGLAMFAIGVGVSVGGLQFLALVLKYGLLDALRACAPGIAALLLTLIAGTAALLLHASRGADRLSQIELESGVLLQLAPSGFAATIRGVTTYYDWEHVAIHEMPGGIAFVLPRRTFHLLPWSALTAGDARRLHLLLDGGAFVHRELDSTGSITLFATYSPTRSPRFVPARVEKR
jgi:hypothetical protein